MTANSTNDAFNNLLRGKIMNAVNEAHRSTSHRPVVINNSTAINALLDVIAVYAGAYGFEDYTSEDLVKKYMDDLPKRIRQYRQWHQQNDTDIIKRRKVN